MVRSMLSGVSGMRTHQAKMDVIGNNIANVNTYGFKSGRMTFRDVYYQTSSSGSTASSSKGGTNPTQIGYGVQMGSVDVMQEQSSFTTTGNGMDVAIAGEGFLQVQDSEGNIFYTRAGMLDIDSSGNLVDVNGNFVLGVSGNPVGKSAGSNKIQLSIPSVTATAAKAEETINNVKYTITSSANSKDANVTFNFASTADLPGGQKSKAEITSSGITVKLNETATFASLADLNTEINRAITEANGGKAHPGGTFTIAAEPATSITWPLTGKEVASTDYAVTPGSATGATTNAKQLLSDGFFGGLKISTTSSSFTGTGTAKFDAKFVSAVTTATASSPVHEAGWEITTTVGGVQYKGYVTENMSSAGSVLLKKVSGSPQTLSDSDTITMSHKGYSELTTAWKTEAASATDPVADTDAFATVDGTTAPDLITFTKSEPSKAIGLSSKGIKLTNGTSGGAQTVKDLSSIAIGSDGIITGVHSVHGKLQLGRIDLANFENPKGLSQSGNTYFSKGANSGDAKVTTPGASGTGNLVTGSLEMSNVDLSKEFSDMITTQRGYQANSRIITVSDTMLEELVNLKR